MCGSIRAVWCSARVKLSIAFPSIIECHNGIMVLVSISDVVEATQNRTRCLIEGEQVLDGNMLITVGSLGMSDAKVLKVWALCLQSSTLSDTPHVIQVSLNLRTIYKRIVSISCSCKAGQSEKCKHCIALLMYLNK